MIDLKGRPFYLNEEQIRWVEETKAAMTLEEKVGQLFVPIGYSGEPEYLETQLLRFHIGGVMYRNGAGAEMQATHRYLQEHSKLPLTIGSNLEDGGNGAATEATFFARQMQVAATGDPGQAYRLEETLVAAYGEGARVTILALRENDDPEIRAVADYVYENVFVHYTMKQWGQTPEEIDPNTTARVPVLLSRDDRYFQDPYQGMPLEGYTPMFRKILDHPNITVELGVDARDRLALTEGGMKLDGEPFAGTVIYTGQVDELFGFRYGRLPYRTLDFGFETLAMDRFQPAATVNYTVSEDYTRITEYKQLTGQELPGVTTIMKEYSRAYTGAAGEIPYYAIISPENNALYEKYRALAEGCGDLHLLGRLAEYKYYNMDAIALRALELCDGLLQK